MDAKVRPLAPLATHTAHFGRIRRTGQVYIDKTAYIQRMLEETIQYAFLARPRRFGKSLLVSTLEHLYARESDDLFQGLDIHASGLMEAVPRCSVVTLNMAAVKGDTPQEIKEEMGRLVRTQYALLDLAPRQHAALPWSALNDLFLALAERRGDIVVLVDEYDAPITRMIENSVFSSADQQTVMSYLRDFYSTLKHWDKYIQFAFVTGITKFSDAGMFSALNNLHDVSHLYPYDAICGFTETEIDRFLAEHVKRSATNYGCSTARLRSELRRQYNGYRFLPGSEPVYNPISYLRALTQLTHPRGAATIRRHGFPRPWIDTGKPYFVFQYMKAQRLGLGDIDDSLAGIWESFDVRRPPLNALMFQTGYLTIASEGAEDRLEFPNREVAAAIREGLFWTYLGKHAGSNIVRGLIADMAAALEVGDCEQACVCFDRILDGVTYGELAAESHFQVSLHIVGYRLEAVLGVEAEVAGRKGRSDIVVETRDAFYVFELKYNRTVQEAVEPMRAKGYGDRYRGRGKKVIGIGLNFRVPPDAADRAAWSHAKDNYAMQTAVLHTPSGGRDVPDRRITHNG